MRHCVIHCLILTAAVSSFGLLTTFSGDPDRSDTKSTDAGGLFTLEPSTPDESLIVHEWGTFTSFSGSDGVALPFRPLTTTDLPPFVLNLADVNGLSFRKGSLTAFQRMETPVTYFYTPTERDVTVKVRFPDGLLTEFYPPPRQTSPDRETLLTNGGFSAATLSTESSTSLNDSMLDWGRIHLIPPDRFHTHVSDPVLAARMGRFTERQIVPNSTRFPHYAKARSTDSAIVQLSPDVPQGSVSTASLDHFEKFLFYRGVSNFEPLVTVEPRGDDSFLIRNKESQITSLFLVSTEGNQVRFSVHPTLAPNEKISLRLPEHARSVPDLSSTVVKALTQEGLYEKEAQAMVDTWSDAWFSEPGTRLFYVLPQQKTDELLPLQVSPTPDETVRIMVGRQELLTPEHERALEKTVSSWLAAGPQEADSDEPGRTIVFSDASASPGSPGSVQTLPTDQAHLESLGRWAEPSLARIATIATDREVRDEATRLLTVLRRSTEAVDRQLLQ